MATDLSSPLILGQQYLSGPDLRRLLNVSDSTLRLWRSKGLPFVGGERIRPRYPLAGVLAWLENDAPASRTEGK